MYQDRLQKHPTCNQCGNKWGVPAGPTRRRADKTSHPQSAETRTVQESTKSVKWGKAGGLVRKMWDQLPMGVQTVFLASGWNMDAVSPPPGLNHSAKDAQGHKEGHYEVDEAVHQLWEQADPMQRELLIRVGLQPPEEPPKGLEELWRQYAKATYATLLEEMKSMSRKVDEQNVLVEKLQKSLQERVPTPADVQEDRGAEFGLRGAPVDGCQEQGWFHVTKHRLLHVLKQAELSSMSEHEHAIVDIVTQLESELEEGTLAHWLCYRMIDLLSRQADDTVGCIEACRDVIAQLKHGRSPSVFECVSANITTWRSEVKHWVADQGAGVALIQETRVLEKDSPAMQAGMEALYRVWTEPAQATGRGGSSGGIAFMVAFGSLYLEDGQDPSTPVNAKILGRWEAGQLPMMQFLRFPGVVAKEEATRFLADVSHSVESSLLLGGNLAGYWNRICVWYVSYPQKTCPTSVQAKLQQHLTHMPEKWQDHPGMTAAEYADRMWEDAILFSQHRSELHRVAKEQLQAATKADRQDIAVRYQAHVQRPFQELAMEVRIHARRQHWLAQEEAQTLPPINFEGAVRKSAKIGKKACGPDEWSADMLRSLTPDAVRVLTEEMMQWEREGVLPKQVYGGDRHIEAEAIMAPPIRTNQGLDLWIDDIGVLFGVVQKKTVFVCTTGAAKAAVGRLRTADEPPVAVTATDLGLDCGGGSRRRVGKHKARVQKARGRLKRLRALGPKDKKVKVRLVKGSLQPVGIYGHQAPGVTPRRMKWLRFMYAEALGRMKVGSVLCVIEEHAHKNTDPKELIVAQHIQAHSRLLKQWPQETESSLAKAWATLADTLKQNRWPWQRVTAPLGAMLTYMRDLGWQTDSPRYWAIDQAQYDVASTSGMHAILWHLRQRIQKERWLDIAKTPGAIGVENGIDWKAAHKALLKLGPLQQTGLKALWQAALKAGSGAWCQRCQQAATIEHVLYDCTMWHGHEEPPPEVRALRLTGACPSLWLRGLPPAREFFSQDLKVEINGVWPVRDTAGIYFATDATGPQDPRAGPVVWGAIAFRLVSSPENEASGELVEVVASITGTLPWEQTVFRGEAAALKEVVLAHPDADGMDITLDCEGVLRRVQRRTPGHSNRDLLDPIREQKHRVQLTWINSHLAPKEFAYKFGAQSEWRRRANGLADALVKDRARRIAGPGTKCEVEQWDAEVGAILQFLGWRVSHLLTADEADKAQVDFEHRPRIKSRNRQGDTMQASAPAVLSRRQRLEQVLQAEAGSGHQWQEGHRGSTNLTISCKTCNLYVQQNEEANVFERKLAQPCIGEGPISSVIDWERRYDPTATAVPSQPEASKKTLVLEQVIPPPQGGVGWAITSEMLDQCLEMHELCNLHRDLTPLDSDLRRQAINWESLPAWYPAIPCDEIFIFTDGSFIKGKSVATWALVVVARQGQHIGTVGFVAGQAQTPGTQEPSAYQGELAGLLHAAALACKTHCPIVHIGSDCQSALLVGTGAAAAQMSDSAARATQALTHLAGIRGTLLLWHKVEAHCGCAFNELADALAKQAGRLKGRSPWPCETPSFDAAVQEHLLEKLWLSCHCIPGIPCLLPSGQWPATSGNPVLQQCDPCPAGFADGPPPQDLCHLNMRVVQYNALSLRGGAAMALIAKGLRHNNIAIAGFQETRQGQTGFSTHEGWWILSASCTDKGVGGTQVWINPNHAGLTWERKCISVFHASPQILVVLSRVNGLDLAIVSAHAPPATSPEEVLDEWWGTLARILARIPSRFTLLQCIDANARFHPDPARRATLESAPICGNARRLRQHAFTTEAEVTDLFSQSGKKLISWRSPAGQSSLLDYILFPRGWKAAATTEDTPDLQDLHGDIDHAPVLLTLDVRCATRRGAAEPRIDVTALQTPAGQAIARRALETVPPIPWEVCSTQHLDHIHRHILQALQELPKAPPKPRNPAYTPATLELVLRKRHIRRCLRTVRQRGEALQPGPQGQQGAGDSQDRQDRFEAQVRQHSRNEESWVRLLRDVSDALFLSMQQDRAEFARAAIANAREAGTREFAYKLRAVLRTGRRFRSPPLVPVFNREDGVTAGREPVLDAFADFFSRPERARPVARQSLYSSQNSPNPQQLRDASDMPSVVQLSSAIARLKRGKAPGISKIPAEVLQSSPLASAKAIWPVMAKALTRDPMPFQWRGGMATAIPKPGKDGSLPQGYRSVMLLEPSAKAVQTAFRPSIQEAFVALRTPLHYGGLSGAPITLPASCARAHLQFLNTKGLCGGAVFIDCASAYYSVAREILAARPEQIRDDQWAQARAAFFFTDVPSQLAFIRALRSHTAAATLAENPLLAHFLAKQLDGTWFVTRTDTQVIMKAESGTAPGSPIAGILFGIVFQRFLRDINATLEKGNYRAFASFTGDTQPDLSAPTWADDVCVLFQTATPEAAPEAVKEILCHVVAAMRVQGLEANMGPGKTEAMLVLHGEGSRQVRRALFCTENPSVAFQGAHGAMEVRLTSEYTHLGCTLRADGTELPCLRHREQQAMQIYRPLRKRLLTNPFLTVREKTDLIRSRVLPSFLHGAGMLTLRNTKDKDKFEDTIFKIYRGSFRPILGVSCQGYTNTEIVAALGYATPSELLTVARARTLAELAKANLQPVLRCLESAAL
ncbi:CACNA1S [Symbiodinium sp. CCMP2456]|nr:CACNA1S [Symbiodinium sp. CCMP2456]